MSAQAISRTPSPAAHFPITIADDISEKAFELLSVDPSITSVSKSDVFTLWQAACAIEHKDPNVLTHTFASDNEFALQAKRFKAVLTGSEF